MSTGVAKIAEKARNEKALVFTSLAHHITSEALRKNLSKISSSTAVGVDEQDVNEAKASFATWSEAMLKSMYHRGYHPKPSRRIYIPKPGKAEGRPISIPTVQDRCLQKSVADVLNGIYEQDFLNCSYGGRPGRSAHQAIANLQEAISRRQVNWVYEADLKNFFGSLAQDWVERFLAHRVREVLEKRLSKFCLALEPAKTKLIRFGRRAMMRDGQEKEEVGTFNFLGFTLYCTKNRKGGFKVGIKTEKSRLNRGCAKMKESLLRLRHRSLREQWTRINVILRGHYRYYGVGGNYHALDQLYYFTLKYWRKALSSRSQKGKVSWIKFNKLLKFYPLRQPKLYLPHTVMKSLVTL